MDVVWGVNAGDSIFIRNGNSWVNVAGLLTHVTVGDAGVWGVNRNRNIFYREGVTLSSLAGTGWTLIPGKPCTENNFVNFSNECVGNFKT